MIMALLRAKLDAAKAAGSGVEAAENELDGAKRLDRAEKRLEISENLRRTMDKWECET